MKTGITDIVGEEPTDGLKYEESIALIGTVPPGPGLFTRIQGLPNKTLHVSLESPYKSLEERAALFTL